MNDPKRLFIVATLLLASTCLVGQLSPQKYFDDNCASCHTIGGGASVGPDLKNVEQRASRHWLVEFIRDPDKKIAAKDPYATKILAESQGLAMTAFPDITEEFGETLLEYIDQQSHGQLAAPAAPALGGSAVRGRELFLGQRQLSNRAAACVACHQASSLPPIGGRLGPDLSTAHLKLGGDRGLSSWLRNPPTRMMSTLFRPAPLTAEEAADLTAYLRTVGENPTRQAQAPLRRVQTAGLLGSLLAFVLAGVIWRGRLRGVRGSVLGNRGGE